jgi:Transposase IS4
LYVITDAETSFALQDIVYTGKATYGQEENENMKKTVSVVKKLCKEYKGTHRTVYVDTFYASTNPMKELDQKILSATGTVM